MTASELQRILGYVNVGLAIAHESGVSVGHFGDTDFIQLAQTANGLLLRAVAVEQAKKTVAAVVAPVGLSVAAVG